MSEYFQALMTLQPPISPLFQTNGPFENYNEDICFTLAFLFLFYIIDKLLVTPYLHIKSRYFALHFLCNIISSFLCFPDVYKAFSGDGRGLFRGPVYTVSGNCCILSLHIYHILAFSLSNADIFHHIVFAGVLSLGSIPVKGQIGIAMNYTCFFLSGLPGGIHYLILVLYYQGYVSRAFEKRVFTFINVYIRGPSMVAMATLWWCNYQAGNIICEEIWALFVLLGFINGQYYNQQAVESAAVYYYRERNSKK
eukprot:Tbor_TRINITY_DN5719_c2_g1::TRINITY_DN5719_c2_g1_i1::g.20386::m.20386